MKKLVILWSLVCLPSVAFAQDEPVIDFNGELVDQNAAPLSGVLPLEFRIYTDSKSKKPLATEKHFVAVVDGAYMVTLGTRSTIKSERDSLSVGVYLENKELTRQDVRVARQLVAANPKVVQSQMGGSAQGDTFKLECPSGYVVTGIEGTHKNGIQSLKLICSQTVK